MYNDILLTYRVAVKQNVDGVNAVKQYLLDHSANPASELYGVHKSRAEVDELVAPHAHSVQAVVDWLAEHGVESHQLQHTANSDFISFQDQLV